MIQHLFAFRINYSASTDTSSIGHHSEVFVVDINLTGRK